MKKRVVILGLLIFLTGCNSAGGAARQKVVNNFVDKQKNISSDKIYAKQEIEASYAYDITQPINLIKEHDDSVVAQIVFGDIEMGIMNNNGTDIPLRPIEVVDIKILSGNVSGTLNNVYMEGGLINLKTYIESVGQERVEKFGFNDLSENEKENLYLDVSLEYDYDFDQGKPYTVVLRKDYDGKYIINTGGYGIFEGNKRERSFKGFENVFTKKILSEGEISIAD